MNNDYWKKWTKENTKAIAVRFNRNKPDDWELFEHVKKQPNQSQYIKALILRDKIIHDICLEEFNDLKKGCNPGKAILDELVQSLPKEKED